MITLEDLSNYFFIVNEDPTDNSIQIGVQITFKEDGKKDSYTKKFEKEYFLNHSVDQLKALLLSEFLETLNNE